MHKLPLTQRGHSLPTAPATSILTKCFNRAGGNLLTADAAAAADVAQGQEGRAGAVALC